MITIWIVETVTPPTVCCATLNTVLMEKANVRPASSTKRRLFADPEGTSAPDDATCGVVPSVKVTCMKPQSSLSR